MNKKLLTTLFAGLALGLSGCSYSAQEAPYEADPVLQVPKTLQKDAFAFAVFQSQATASLASSERKNLILSPASLENLLGILREGARGATRAAIDKLSMGQRGVKSAMRVESANALFVDESLQLRPVSVKDIQRLSFADATGAAETINTWCKDKTHGLIPEIVTPEDFPSSEPTSMVAANAVYLKEKWLRPFGSDDTHRRIFQKSNGQTVAVDMMSQKGWFRCAAGADWQAVALFYRTDGREGEPGCFIAILPKGDACRFAAGLTAEKYNAIRLALAKAHPEEVTVNLPKMEMRNGEDSLSDTLKRLGLDILFDRDKADFSGFAPELCLKGIRQRCYVKVDEKKTEAAAVTTSDIIPQCVPTSITFDRPFVWAIGDLTTGAAPYFIGVCEQP